MKEHGVQYTCTRCNKTVFVPDNRKPDAHGSYEAPMPGDWLSVHGGHLCPTCTDLYNKMMNQFYAPEVKRKVDLGV